MYKYCSVQQLWQICIDCTMHYLTAVLPIAHTIVYDTLVTLYGIQYFYLSPWRTWDACMHLGCWQPSLEEGIHHSLESWTIQCRYMYMNYMYSVCTMDMGTPAQSSMSCKGCYPTFCNMLLCCLALYWIGLIDLIMYMYVYLFWPQNQQYPDQQQFWQVPAVKYTCICFLSISRLYRNVYAQGKHVHVHVYVVHKCTLYMYIHVRVFTCSFNLQQ